MENVHDGHRERLRNRFIENGIDAFESHEVLELLLFYALPRINTNDIAHNLLNEFKTLSGVLNAPLEELQRAGKLTQKSAVLLKLVPGILNLYQTELNSDTMDNIKAVTNYFKSCYIGITEEQLRVCCLDDNLRVIACPVVSKGIPNSVPVYTRKIVETAIRHNCSMIILAHNHPNGDSIPSKKDISITKQLLRTLEDIGINLLDHIIVGKPGPVSMKDAGYFSIFD